MPKLRKYVLAALLTAAACAALAQTPVPQKVDTVYDTVYRVDTVAQTAANDKYYDLAEKAIEHQKDWIDTVLIWFTILLTIASILSPIFVIQFNRYRKEAAKDAQDTTTQITEHLRKAREDIDKALERAEKQADKLLEATTEKCVAALSRVEQAVIEAEDRLQEMAKMAAQMENVRSTAETTAAPAMAKPAETVIQLEERLKLIQSAHAQEAVDKFEQLVTDMEKAGIGADRIPVSIHKNIGLSYMALKKWPEAIGELQAYVQAKPTDEEALLQLGDAHALAGDYDQALMYWQRVAELNPFNAVAFNKWGVGLAHMYDTVKDTKWLSIAFQKYERAIEIVPHFFVAYGNWGNALARMYDATEDLKWFDLAVEKFKKAIYIRGDYAPAFNGWGFALLTLHAVTKDKQHFDDAIVKIEESLKFDPQYAPAWLSLAEVHGYAGDRERMMEPLKKAVSLDAEQKKLARESAFLKAYRNDPDFIALTKEDSGEQAG